MMTAPLTLGTGANAVPRAPTTTGQPLRIRSHSFSPLATAHPRCSSLPLSRLAHDSVGTSTSSDPSRESESSYAPRISASGSVVGET